MGLADELLANRRLAAAGLAVAAAAMVLLALWAPGGLGLGGSAPYQPAPLRALARRLRKTLRETADDSRRAEMLVEQMGLDLDEEADDMLYYVSVRGEGDDIEEIELGQAQEIHAAAAAAATEEKIEDLDEDIEVIQERLEREAHF